MTGETANFQLLPGDPLRFFDLPPKFDRDALRRAYGRWIRRYKPDRYPVEFQKIRAAYELLDARLRYGQPLERESNLIDWSANAATFGEDNRSRGEPTPERAASKSLAERLQTEAAGDVYAALNRQPRKAPFDYYTLAVLADVVQTEDSALFAKWIMTGLKEFPNDPALQRLLQEFLGTDVATAKLPTWLSAVAQVIPNDRFYFVTEAAWDRLLREADFPLLRQTLAACESHLRDYRIAGKLAFYVHLLKAAVWRADRPWLAAAFRFVEENAQELKGHADFELEFASLAWQAAARGADFAQGNPVRQAIIEALRVFCCGNYAQGLQAVVRTQVLLASDSIGVMAAFPAMQEEAVPQILQLWQMVGQLVTYELGADEPPVNPSLLERSTLQLLKDMRAEVGPVVTRHVNFQRLVRAGWGGGIAFFPTLLLSGFLPIPALLAVVTLIVVGYSVAYRLYLGDKWFDPWFQKQLFNHLKSAYNGVWRPRLFRHQYSVRTSSGEMIHALVRCARETHDDNWAGWIVEMLMSDTGFFVYAAAQPYLR